MSATGNTRKNGGQPPIFLPGVIVLLADLACLKLGDVPDARSPR